MSGRCASTISRSSSNEPRRGTSPAGASRPSPTSPSIVKGARPPRFSSSRTSPAQPPVPTTSTRRFAMLRTACSQAAESAKTTRAVSARAAAPGSIPGIQRSNADTATSPVTVPAAEATAGPRVK